MRFEKLNENKIRITLTNQDLAKKNIDFHSFMADPIESQGLFFDMLDEAEEKIGFVTKDYRIRIEALQISSGDFVLIITRSLPQNEKSQDKKKIHIRRKRINNFKENEAIYCFSTFDDFCCFSNFINSNHIKFANIAKNISLYEYNNQYYLSFSNINLNYTDFKKVFSIITEFATYVSNADLFKRKLIENGKTIMKNNAIKIAIQYFSPKGPGHFGGTEIG